MVLVLKEYTLLPLFYWYFFSLKVATVCKVSTVNPNSGVETEIDYVKPPLSVHPRDQLKSICPAEVGGYTSKLRKITLEATGTLSSMKTAGCLQNMPLLLKSVCMPVLP